MLMNKHAKKTWVIENPTFNQWLVGVNVFSGWLILKPLA
jgi:hypothetical protein